jgi:hypothetical protein
MILTFTGTIAGGTGTAIDTLDYQAFTSPVSVDLGWNFIRNDRWSKR